MGDRIFTNLPLTKFVFWKLWKSKKHFFYKIRKIFFVFVLQCIQRENLFTVRVSTGIPGYGLSTEMIRKFFPFPLWKRFRKTGIPERFPERFFFRKTEISGTLFRNYGSLQNNVPEISGFPNNGKWYHNYIKVLHM